MVEEAKSEKQTAPAPVRQGWRIVSFESLKNPPVWLAASAYVLAALLALAVLILIAFGLYATFQIAYETVVGEINDRVEAAKVFFPILLALVGGPLLIWRVVTAHMQATAARHQATVAQEGLYTSLFTKAVEQLGATRGEIGQDGNTIIKPNREVRIGAIYALERIAQDSARDHWTIMEVLSTYVRSRENCGVAKKPPNNVRPGSAEYVVWLSSSVETQIDIQAALDVIGRRSAMRISDERLRGHMLEFAWANLQSYTLSGDFSDASFAYCNFEGAIFMNANFRDARFYQASLSHVLCLDADFERADLSLAKVDGMFLQRARLEKTLFYGVDLSTINGLNESALAQIIGDAATKLPKGMPRPANWSKETITVKL